MSVISVGSRRNDKAVVKLLTGKQNVHIYLVIVGSFCFVVISKRNLSWICFFCFVAKVCHSDRSCRFNVVILWSGTVK